MTGPTIEHLFAECAALADARHPVVRPGGPTWCDVSLDFEPARASLERFRAVARYSDDRDGDGFVFGPYAPEPWIALMLLRKELAKEPA